MNEIYEKRWSNYQSDKHKSKRLLKCEISCLLSTGVFYKEDLVRIRDLLKILDKSGKEVDRRKVRFG